MVKPAGSWLVMNPGGAPTPDRPGISLMANEARDEVSAFMDLRVADIHAVYEDWRAKGAEIRCYLRDPDRYLIEVGRSTGLLRGDLVTIRPEDPEG